jgi:glutathione synthase/RimK-type ligase-like ATP-grasp enzyme
MKFEKIIALIDYKGKFGSKHFDIPYRSGMDKSKLSRYFYEFGYQIEYMNFSDVEISKNDYSNANIIYTSSEDIDYLYKSYIEDIVLALELKGAKLIPSFKDLRANNNKVFMEILGKIYLNNTTIPSMVFGSSSELKAKISSIKFPCILKSAEGASGTGVFLIKTESELFNSLKSVSKKRNYMEDLKDYLRFVRHKGYIREDVHRTKFVIQELVPKLKEDWKIYIFGEKLYIFKRPIQKGRGIKASGGGYDNYVYGKESNPPKGIKEYAFEIYKKLKVPHISIDIAYDGEKFHLIEFQSLYFGTAGIPYSKGYYVKRDANWLYVEEKLEIEKVYADSIIYFLKS